MAVSVPVQTQGAGGNFTTQHIQLNAQQQATSGGTVVLQLPVSTGTY